MTSDAGPRPGRRVTMKDVAKRAGVSQPTVSFVLNDRRDVSVAEETRARVLEAAAELNFRPNRAAQSLRSNRPYTIGVITDQIVSQPYAGQILLGIQQAVQPSGYVCYVVERAGTADTRDDAVSNLLAQGVAGVIYASHGANPIRASRGARDTRSVYVNCWPHVEGEEACVVLADEYAGGALAATAAFEAGHRDVVFLGGFRDDYACHERERGFVDAARRAGLDPDKLRRVYGGYQIGSGYQLALSVLRESAPTALVCGNDRMAVGALLAVHSLGLECPRDVSIIGYDDQPDIADQVHPALTTVRLPHLEMGALAGRLMLADGDPDPGRHLVDCELVVRNSLAAPRAGA